MKMNKHEKDVELARASAPRYGIYLHNEKPDLAVNQTNARTVLDILNAPGGDEVKIKALEVIGSLNSSSMDYSTISNCSVKMGGSDE